MKKKGKLTSLTTTIGVNYCEICQEWVEEPRMVCEYRGRYGLLTIVNEGWPDRKPVKSNIHRFKVAIDALEYYAKRNFDGFMAQEALKVIRGENETK